jgi:hypothetical protein
MEFALHSRYNITFTQEVLGRINRLLAADTTRTAKKTKKKITGDKQTAR